MLKEPDDIAQKHTFTGGGGLFDPSAVSNFGLYWGHPNNTGEFTLQSTVANPSAVPELGSFAALAGLADLVFTLYRRRRRTLTNA